MSGVISKSEATAEQIAEAERQQTRSGPPTATQLETVRRMRADRGITGKPEPTTNGEASAIITDLLGSPSTEPARQEQLDAINVLAKQLNRTFVNDGWTVDRAGAILYRLRQQAGRRNAQRLASVTDPVGVQVEAEPKPATPAPVADDDKAKFDAIVARLANVPNVEEKLDELLKAS